MRWHVALQFLREPDFNSIHNTRPQQYGFGTVLLHFQNNCLCGSVCYFWYFWQQKWKLTCTLPHLIELNQSEPKWTCLNFTSGSFISSCEHNITNSKSSFASSNQVFILHRFFFNIPDNSICSTCWQHESNPSRPQLQVQWLRLKIFCVGSETAITGQSFQTDQGRFFYFGRQ